MRKIEPEDVLASSGLVFFIIIMILAFFGIANDIKDEDKCKSKGGVK